MVTHNRGANEDLLVTTSQNACNISNSPHKHEHQEILCVYEDFFTDHNPQLNEQKEISSHIASRGRSHN